MWDGLVGLALAGGLLWLVSRNMPPMHDFGQFMRHVPDAITSLARSLSVWLRDLNIF